MIKCMNRGVLSNFSSTDTKQGIHEEISKRLKKKKVSVM